MKQPTDSKCTMCCKAEGHIQQIVLRCKTLAPSEYTNRHNKVAICKHMRLQVTDKYYEHTPDRDINSTVPLLCGTYWLSQIDY
jgi:hypothetical protein